MNTEPSKGVNPGPGEAGRPDASSHRPLEDVSKLALEAAGVGTWNWDFASGVVVCDEIMHKLFGLKPGTFSGRREDLDALIHPEDRERVRAEVAHCLKADVEFNREYRVIWPADGSVHFLRSRGRIYRDGNGHAIQMTGACWDISDRMTVAEELERERFLLGTLMEHIPDKIYFKDTDSRFIWLSRETLEKFNATDPAEVLGKTDFDFFREEHARQAFEDEQQIIRTGTPLVNLEERETWADGRETWVSTTKMPLIDPQGRIIGTFGLSRDITARKRAEEQLARYAEELRRRNRDLEDDLGMARELQGALLPQRYPCFPHNASPEESAVHFSHFFHPSTAVSGDFFDILELSDTMAGVFVCDVMGHGVRAALVAALVRALVEELKGIGAMPGEFLGKINRALVGILKQTDIPMFASASYVVADLARGEIRYANAGHPDPLCVRRRSTAVQTSPLNHVRRGPVLGMFEQAQYDACTSLLSPHDKVLLFTDGLFEVEDESGEYYDQSRLISAVSRRADLSAADLCREVLAEIQQFSVRHEFNDDVCLVAMEVGRLSA